MKQNKDLLLPAILMFIVVIAGAIIRVIEYPYNFTPIFAMAIFGGAIVKDKKYAFVMPLFAMLLADIMFQMSGKAIGLWGWGQLLGYGIIALVTIISFRLKKVNVLNVGVYALMGPTIFYLLSNLSFFLIDNKIYHTYPQTLDGLKLCYIEALPFYRVNILSTLVYSAVLFGSYYFITNFVWNNKKATA